MKIPTSLRYAIGGLLMAALLVAIEYWIGWQQLLHPWQAVSPLAVATAASLVIFSYLLRAARLYDYFRPATQGRFCACVRLMLWHNLWNNLLPMRSGELSFPLLMQRYFHTPLAQSVPALLWFRLLDLHSLLALALTALAGTWLPAWQVGALLLVWLSVPWLGFRFQQWGVAAIRRPAWQARARAFQSGLPQNAAAFWRSWFWTLLNWLVKLAVFAWVLGLFVDLSPAATLLGAVGGELTSVLPVHGIAGAGSYEAGIVAALLAFDVATASALQGAVNLHMFLLSLSLLGGGLAWLLNLCPSTPTS